MGDTEGSVLRALELAERHAFYASRVDWPAVRAEAIRRVAAGASTIGALKPVWEALGDRHSHVRPPAPRHGISPERVAAHPSGELRDTVAYLRLPPIRSASTGPGGGADYVRTAARIVRENQKARAWLVDLRGNTGGTIHPMLAAVGPLLGPGTVLSYRRRTGSGARFAYLPEGLLVNDRLALPASPDPPDLHDVPVAVLHDGRTASAAEGVVVAFAGRARARSFGAATYGVPTGNVTYPLPDGFVLVITTSVATDRTGHSYDGPITPTHAVFDPDHAMNRAISWANELARSAFPDG